jgi:hypothetical protein
MINTGLFLLLPESQGSLVFSMSLFVVWFIIFFCVYFSIGVVEIERVMLNKRVASTNPSAKNI